MKIKLCIIKSQVMVPIPYVQLVKVKEVMVPSLQELLELRALLMMTPTLIHHPSETFGKEVVQEKLCYVEVMVPVLQELLEMRVILKMTAEPTQCPSENFGEEAVWKKLWWVQVAKAGQELSN